MDFRLLSLMHPFRILCILLAFLGTALSETPPPLLPRITSGLETVNKLYFSPTLKIWLDRTGDDLRGHWESRVNPPWWSAANAVELMIDEMNATGSTKYDAGLLALHELHRDAVKRWPLVAAELKKRGQWKADDEARLKRRMEKGSTFTEFRNEYMDDSGWWGIAWLKMHERTGDKRCLATAEAIQKEMAAQWRPELGGGVIWCLEEGKQNPNTISNTLFLILSSRLAIQTGDPSFKDWAIKAHAWLHEKSLFDGIGVVDGPGHKGDYWSYNQGTYLGGLIAFAEAAKQPAAMDEAAQVVQALLTKAGFINADGVIVEKLGTSGWDGALFKGIFARYLRQTSDAFKKHTVHLELAKKIDDALTVTANSILNHAMAEDNQFAADWNQHPKNAERNFNTDISALMALLAAMK